MRLQNPSRLKKIAASLVAPALLFGATFSGPVTAQDHSTPAATYSCASATAVPATPAMDHGDMEMDMSTEVEFDQLYIDMMLPHHGSIVALAQVALPELTDPRLQEMAQNIIDTQTAEQQELQQYREAWYGSAEPMPMDQHMMDMMMQAMPGMGSSMESMDNQMSAEWQVSTFCSAADPDLAFIEQTIPHHEMAVMASEDALDHAVHPEIVEFAQRVIDAQQMEIDELHLIWTELTGEATPAA